MLLLFCSGCVFNCLAFPIIVAAAVVVDLIAAFVVVVAFDLFLVSLLLFLFLFIVLVEFCATFSVVVTGRREMEAGSFLFLG